MKQIPLSALKDDPSRFLSEAASERIVITRHGRPAGVLLGFASEDDWIDSRLEHDSGFLQRIVEARASIGAGKGVRIEELGAHLQERHKVTAPAPSRKRTPGSSRPAASAGNRQAPGWPCACCFR